MYSQNKVTPDEEFIRQAKLDWEDHKIETIKDALEACYMNGDYDEIGGESEAPTGHYYQIEHWIVVTNDQGFSTVHAYESIDEAEKEFEIMEREYTKWLKAQEAV